MFRLRDEVSSGSVENFVDPIVGLITSSQEKQFWERHVPKKRLGSGSFGGVFAATRLEDNLSVAVKVIPRKGSQFVMKREEPVPKEVVTLQQLSHVKGVINLLDWMDTGDKVLLVLEHPANSTDLKTFLKTHGPCSEETTRLLMTQLLSIINQMREANVLHRDLKLENILVDRDTLKLKVIDFGLTSTFSSLTQSFRTFMGTSSYLPPEMFVRKRFIAGPGIVWALGVAAFKLLTGLSPFDGTEEYTLDGRPKYPGYLSESCKDFLESCFMYDADDRISLDDLDSHFWLSEEPSTLSTSSFMSKEDHEMSSSPEYSEFTSEMKYNPATPQRRKRLDKQSESSEYPRSSNKITPDDLSFHELMEENLQQSYGTPSVFTKATPPTFPTELMSLFSQQFQIQELEAAQALCFLQFR